VFRRVDLDGYEVEATIKNVAKVSYATSLMKQGADLDHGAPIVGVYRNGRG